MSWLGIDNLRIDEELVAFMPVYASIDLVTYAPQDGLRFLLVVHEALKDSVVLSYHVTRTSEPYHRYIYHRVDQIPLATLSSSRGHTSEIVRLEGLAPIPISQFHRDDSVETVLGFDMGQVDSKTTRISNLIHPPSYVRFAVSTDGWSRLQEMIGLKEAKGVIAKRSQDAFALGVSWLLASLGFSVFLMEIQDLNLKLGVFREDGREKGEVDLLAFDHADQVPYLIDCTITSPDHSKIDRMVSLSNFVRSKVGMSCLPAIFVADDAPEAKQTKSGVRVFDKRDLAKLVQWIMEGDSESARRFLSGRGPS